MGVDEALWAGKERESLTRPWAALVELLGCQSGPLCSIHHLQTARDPGIVFECSLCTITLRISPNTLVSELGSQLRRTAPGAWYASFYGPHSLEEIGNTSFERAVLCTRSVVITRRC